MAQHQGSNPPGASTFGAPWKNAYLHPPAAAGVYWCAYENGGCWLGYYIGGKWDSHESLKGEDDDMGRIEFYLDFPEHPFKAERSKAWHER